MKISTAHTRSVTADLLDTLDALGMPSDVEFVRDGIRYLRENEADDYAFIVELKLRDIQSERHTVFNGFDRNGKAIFINYVGLLY